MDEQEMLRRMVAPGTPRANKWRGGVIQVHVTRACDKACSNCTQGSEFGGPFHHITLENFKLALESLRGYFGVIGVFGGNPAAHPQFTELCAILERSWVPFEQRGLWCNNPITLAKATAMRGVFNPAVSNINVHKDVRAMNLFREGWPEAKPFGLHDDSMHAPVYVAMRDRVRKKCSKCDNGRIVTVYPHFYVCDECGGVGTVPDEDRIRELISACDINQHWSAMVCQFRGQLRAFFCEVAGAQAILNQDDVTYPDTGRDVTYRTPGMPDVSWWQLEMGDFADQVRKHCFECGVPLRGRGHLATEELSQVSETHKHLVRKRGHLELITVDIPLEASPSIVTRYLQNAK